MLSIAYLPSRHTVTLPLLIRKKLHNILIIASDAATPANSLQCKCQYLVAPGVFDKHHSLSPFPLSRIDADVPIPSQQLPSDTVSIVPFLIACAISTMLFEGYSTSQIHSIFSLILLNPASRDVSVLLLFLLISKFLSNPSSYTFSFSSNTSTFTIFDSSGIVSILSADLMKFSCLGLLHLVFSGQNISHWTFHPKYKIFPFGFFTQYTRPSLAKCSSAIQEVCH